MLNKIPEKNNVSCTVVWLGSGTKVMSKVSVVNMKPARTEAKPLIFDICLM